MSVLKAIGRLLGYRDPPPAPGEMEARWRAALERYRLAEAQLRETSSPEDLELAHHAWLLAQAELQWEIRLAKRELGIPIRPIGITHRLYQQMLNRFGTRHTPGNLAIPGLEPLARGRFRIRRRVCAASVEPAPKEAWPTPDPEFALEETWPLPDPEFAPEDAWPAPEFDQGYSEENRREDQGVWDDP